MGLNRVKNIDGGPQKPPWLIAVTVNLSPLSSGAFTSSV